MKQVTAIGLDLAKKVSQVHGVDATGGVTVRRARVLAFFANCRPVWLGSRRVRQRTTGRARSASRARGPADPTGLCEGVCPAQQKRPSRC
jgi:hypothetical protein